MLRSPFGARVDRFLVASTRAPSRRRRSGAKLFVGLERLEARELLATVTVHIFDFNFSTNPSGGAIVAPTIKVGDTIHWVLDGGIHSTTSVNGLTESWDSGTSSTPGFSFN